MKLRLKCCKMQGCSVVSSVHHNQASVGLSTDSVCGLHNQEQTDVRDEHVIHACTVHDVYHASC